MKNHLSASAHRMNHLLRTPDEKHSRRVASNDRFIGRSIGSNNADNLTAADSNARFSICYLPGVSEHPINTGKTFQEAQMKVVFFACEVERLTSQNYELVKENEVLRTQTNKSEREKDLETKLAIVLAENEKLNQVIEELYEFYMSEKGGDSHEGYERRIEELLGDLDEWKQRCQTLQGTNDIQGALRHLEEDNHKLRDLLGERDREVETLRARIQSPSGEVNVLEEKIIWLVEENTKLKEEAKARTPRAAAGNNNSDKLLQEYREKTNQLIHENETLKGLLNSTKAALISKSPARGQPTFEGDSASPEKIKRAGHSEPQSAESDRLKEQLSLLLRENERLNAVVGEKLAEIDGLRRNTSGNSRVEELNGKIKSLLDRNNELNNLVVEKDHEVEQWKKRQHNPHDGSSAVIEDLRNKLILLTNENDRLNNLLLQTAEELERLKKNDSSALNDVIKNKERINEELRRRIKDLENGSTVNDDLKHKLHLLTAENERLNHLAHDQLEENDRLRKRLTDGELNSIKIHDLQRGVDIHKDEANRANALAQERLAELEKLRRSTGTHEELRSKLLLLTQENERLNSMLTTKIEDLEKARRQIGDLQASSYKVEQLNIKIKTLLDENDKLQRLLLEKNRESDDIRVKLAELSDVTRVLEDLKNKLQLVTNENERLNQIIVEKLREIEQLRHQLGDANGSKWKVEDLSRERERLAAALQDKIKELEEIRRKYYDLQSDASHVDQLKSKIILVTEENERLNNLLLDKAREVENLRGELIRLESSGFRIRELEERVKSSGSDNDRLNKIVAERAREIEALRSKLITLESSSSIIEELKARIVVLTKETERLNGLVHQRHSDIDQLNIRISSSDSSEGLKLKVQSLLNENERLNALLMEKFREIEDLKRRLSSVDSNTQVHELQIRLENVNRDLDALRRLLNEKDSDLAHLRRKIADNETGTALIAELQGKLSLISSENKRLVDELNRLKTELELSRSQQLVVLNSHEEKHKRAGQPAPSAELEHRVRQVADLEERIRIMGNEASRLTAALAEKDLEISRIRQLSGQAESLQHQLKQVLSEKAQLEALLTSNYREMEALKARAGLVDKLEGEVKGLRDHFETVLRQSEEYRRRIVELEGANGRTRELEHSLEIVKGDNAALRKALEDKIKALNELEGRLRTLQVEKERLAHLIEDKTRDIELAKHSHSENVKLERKRSEGEREAVERRAEGLFEENERLKTYLNQNLAELEELKKRYVELENLRSQEIHEFREQFETLKDINREIKDLQLKSAAERTAYETQLAQYEMALNDLERQNTLLSGENERLNALNVQRLEELEKLKRRNVEGEEVYKLEVVELKAQIETYKANAHDIKQLAIKYSADRAADQSHIKQLQQLNENYKAEIDKLYELADQRKGDLENLQTYNEELRQSQAQIVLRLKQTGEIEDRNSVEKFELLQHELKELENARNEYKLQAERNSLELTRRNKDLVDKIQQLDVLKMKYEEAFANYQALNFKLFERLSL